MKKLLLTLCFGLLLAGCTQNAEPIDTNPTPENPQTQEQKENNENSDLNILTLFNSESTDNNEAWVGTFQLVFNDMKNNIIKRDIKFAGIEPTFELKGLNSEEFNSTMLNKSSYYTSYGKTSELAKKKVLAGIWAKFQEKSELVESLDWSEGEGRYYAYAMLKKKFDFLKAFDELDDSSFNNSKEKYDYFGIQNSSDEVLDDNVNILFYTDENNYAIQLYTKQDDIVYLYRTDEKKNFKNSYDTMIKNAQNFTGEKRFLGIDTLKIPELKFNASKEYPELCNKRIEGTDLLFSTAIETLEFELDKEGGKVKSEAIIMTELTALAPEDFNRPIPRHFNFDKPFMIFLIDKDKNDPYMALRVKDLKYFQD